MKANREFELLLTRSGPEPAFMADPRRRDRLEVVSIESGEVVFFWELPARAAARLRRQLQEDLVTLDPEAFVEAWSRLDAAQEGER